MTLVGPLGSGLLVEHLGFVAAFDAFAIVAALAAALFIFFMPETNPRGVAAALPARIEIEPKRRGDRR